MPAHETETCCIDGLIEDDGTFIRHDGTWNPSLDGWIRLIADDTNDEFLLRFEAGYAVEVRDGDRLAAGMRRADESPNDWCVKTSDSPAQPQPQPQPY